MYGLGESRGTIEKSGKKFTMEGRDALSYDYENGESLPCGLGSLLQKDD